MAAKINIVATNKQKNKKQTHKQMQQTFCHAITRVRTITRLVFFLPKNPIWSKMGVYTKEPTNALRA